MIQTNRTLDVCLRFSYHPLIVDNSDGLACGWHYVADELLGWIEHDLPVLDRNLLNQIRRKHSLLYIGRAKIPFFYESPRVTCIKRFLLYHRLIVVIELIDGSIVIIQWAPTDC